MSAFEEMEDLIYEAMMDRRFGTVRSEIEAEYEEYELNQILGEER